MSLPALSAVEGPKPLVSAKAPAVAGSDKIYLNGFLSENYISNSSKMIEMIDRNNQFVLCRNCFCPIAVEFLPNVNTCDNCGFVFCVNKQGEFIHCSACVLGAMFPDKGYAPPGSYSVRCSKCGYSENILVDYDYGEGERFVSFEEVLELKQLGDLYRKKFDGEIPYCFLIRGKQAKIYEGKKEETILSLMPAVNALFQLERTYGYTCISIRGGPAESEKNIGMEQQFLTLNEGEVRDFMEALERVVKIMPHLNVAKVLAQFLQKRKAGGNC